MIYFYLRRNVLVAELGGRGRGLGGARAGAQRVRLGPAVGRRRAGRRGRRARAPARRRAGAGAAGCISRAARRRRRRLLRYKYTSPYHYC